MCRWLQIVFLKCYIISLSIPPPPSSPLFPYTTLFRSRSLTDLFRAERSARIRILDKLRDDFGHVERRRALDRKSTRLNSSHTVISYAVFCLKKKTVCVPANCAVDRAAPRPAVCSA